MTRTMKAAICERYGPAEVLSVGEVPMPVPGPGEIRLRIEATVATPPDVAFRAADPFIIRFMFGLFRPRQRIIGSVFAGVVDEVGKGVTRFAPGERVYGASDSEFGTYAQYKCMAETGVIAKVPDAMSFAEAAALSEGFLTAMPFLRDEARLQPGQLILINGASGNVGAVAVQLARHMGANVTGVSSARNTRLVLELGADEAIDYQKRDFTADAPFYDVIFDAVGKSSFRRCRRALRPGGVYLTTVPSWAIMFDMLRGRRRDGKRARLATTGLRPVADKRDDLEILNGLAARGIVKAVIERSYPLTDIVSAHRHVETGRKIGSVVVLPHADACSRADSARSNTTAGEKATASHLPHPFCPGSVRQKRLRATDS